MGGVIGAMSSKFVLAAGTLLFASRVGMHSTSATLDPSLPTTEVGGTLAHRLHIDAAEGNVSRAIGIGHTEIALRTLAIDPDSPNALTIGADVLRKVELSIDFPRKRLRLIEAGDYRRATSHMTMIPVSFTADGCLSFAATGRDGEPLRVALIGGTPPSLAPAMPTKIKVGQVTLNATAYQPKARCSANDVSVDWQAFDGKQILLDIRHDRMWTS